MIIPVNKATYRIKSESDYRRIISAKILFIFFSLLFVLPSFIIAQEDSIKVKKHSPKRAALYSTIIPGLGQAYNKKYWKIPIVYAGIGACAYFANFSQGRYNEFRDAWTTLNATDPNGSMEFDGYTYTLNGLETGKNYYRRNRDLFTIFTAGVYIINIIDASVDAHLFDFDVSDDLSFHIQPVALQFANTGSISPGFSIKMTWR